MKQDIRIAVLILNYNGRKFLSPIFSALEFLREDARASVILIDNASHDGSVEYCQKAFPWVRSIRNDDNFGWGEGYNKGVAALFKEDSSFSHLLFLNNDTMPSKVWFDKLYEAACENDPGIGEWGCRTFFSDDLVTENLFESTRKFANEEVKLVFLNSGPHFEVLDPESTPVLRAAPSSNRKGIFRKYLAEDSVGYTVQVENNGPRNTSVVLKPGLFARQLSLVKAVALYEVFEGASGQVELEVPSRGKILIFRSFAPDHVFVPHIQNSGIGLTRNFEGYDLQAYQPVDAPQDRRNFVGVCGVSKLVRVDVFRRLDGFDRGYFMYYEDLDFSLRLHKLGYRSAILSNSLLAHHHGGSSNVRSKFFARQVAWSLLYFQWHHGPWFTKWKGLLGTILRARAENDKEYYRSQQINRFALSKFLQLPEAKSSLRGLIKWAGGGIL